MQSPTGSPTATCLCMVSSSLDLLFKIASTYRSEPAMRNANAECCPGRAIAPHLLALHVPYQIHCWGTSVYSGLNPKTMRLSDLRNAGPDFPVQVLIAQECIRKVTEDGERTMRTCLSAAGELKLPEQLPQGWPDDCRAVHLEGYCLYRPQLAEHIITTARRKGALVSPTSLTVLLQPH